MSSNGDDDLPSMDSFSDPVTVSDGDLSLPSCNSCDHVEEDFESEMPNAWKCNCKCLGAEGMWVRAAALRKTMQSMLQLERKLAAWAELQSFKFQRNCNKLFSVQWEHNGLQDNLAPHHGDWCR